MLELDVPVGLAVDGSASNDGSNLLEEMRVAYLLHRLNWSRKAPSGYEILKLATRGSARILGRDELGQISPGMAADFFLVDFDRIEMVGAQFDPASALCTVGLKGSVDYTVVNGRIVVRDGRLVLSLIHIFIKNNIRSVKFIFPYGCIKKMDGGENGELVGRGNVMDKVHKKEYGFL